ncbi:MAG: D-alanyl-D-alanine carboxypeptidase [Gammaproteobacteria bacterium]|nr:D-alanyl-D-alanine carboxypeptidase [Gammaproteobacteria bacterium]
MKTLLCTALLVFSALSAAAPPAAAPALPVPAAPILPARAYILFDAHSGKVLAEQKADERMEPASLTKLLTAYTVFQAMATGKINLADQVTISEKAWKSEGSRMFVQVGSKVSVDDLLKGMIVQSGNDATIALAEHTAGSETTFVTLMNQNAQLLGMKNSRFTNSTGLPDPELYITARDIALLARALIRDFPDYYKYYSIKEFTYNNIKQYNRNMLLWRDIGADGVKTGHTENAGFCLVSSALRDNMRLIAAVLGTASEKERADQSQELLNYGFRFFETQRLYSAAQPLKTTRIWKGASKELKLGLSEDLYVTIPRGQYGQLQAAMEMDKTIIAPAAKDKKYGTVKITLGGETIAERPLVALQAVEQGGWWRRMIDSIRLWFA